MIDQSHILVSYLGRWFNPTSEKSISEQAQMLRIPERPGGEQVLSGEMCWSLPMRCFRKNTER